MNFAFMSEISESKLIPNRHTLYDYDSNDLAELAFINLLSLRILLAEHETATFAQNYCRKTCRWGDFKHWRIDATDVYATLYGLISDEEKEHRPHKLKIYMPIEPLLLYRWIRNGADQRHDESVTHRLFVKLDTMFRIQNSSLRSIRRLIMDWNEITVSQRRLALTRLLQFMRTRAAKGELLSKLNHVAVLKNLEIDCVENPETGEKKEHPSKRFLHSLALENATAGATSAANVASVTGGLGAGFDDDYSKSVYPSPKKIIKRLVATD